MAQDLDPRNNGRLEPLDLRRHGYFLQYAVNAVANAQLVLKRLQMNVRSPQLDRVCQYLIYKFDDGSVLGGAVQVGVLFPRLIDHLQRGVLVQRVNRIRAHAQMLLHLAADGFAGGQDRFEFQAGQRLQRVQPLRGEESAGRHFDRPVDPLQRQQFRLEQNPRREKGKQLAVRVNVIQRGESQAVFLGQPAQYLLLRLKRGQLS